MHTTYPNNPDSTSTISATELHSLIHRMNINNLTALLRGLLLKARYRNIHGGWFAVEHGANIKVNRKAHIWLGQAVCFKAHFSAHFRGDISIGDRVYFNRNCHVVVHQQLSIGDDCLFGEMVSIHDENHIVSRGTEPVASRGFQTAPIEIGRNVWVGAKATILSGVRIGDNAVVAAHALVSRDVPAYTVVAGVPARVIKEITD